MQGFVPEFSGPTQPDVGAETPWHWAARGSFHLGEASRELLPGHRKSKGLLSREAERVSSVEWTKVTRQLLPLLHKGNFPPFCQRCSLH